MTLKRKVKVTHKLMKRVLTPTMMHIWCEYGECSLKCSGLIVLTSVMTLKVKVMTLKMKVRVTYNE